MLATMYRIDLPAAANDNSATEAQTDASVRRAAFEAAMVEWHAYQARAAKATRAYDKHANRHGNHTPRKLWAPRDDFAPGYYEGGYRMVIDGVPIRMAAHVTKWKPANKRVLCSNVRDKDGANGFIARTELVRAA